MICLVGFGSQYFAVMSFFNPPSPALTINEVVPLIFGDTPFSPGVDRGSAMDLVVSGLLKLGLETVSDLLLAFSHELLVRCSTITDSMVAGIDPAVLSCLLG